VHVARHAVDAACKRSRDLAHPARLVVLQDIRAEVEDAIRAGRISEKKPNGRRTADSTIRFATSEDGERCHVLRLVESDRDGLAWLALTCFAIDETSSVA